MNQVEMQKIGKSLLNSFIAAVVALVSAGESDPKILINAGIGAVSITVARYLNPKDQSFGLKKKAA